MSPKRAILYARLSETKGDDVSVERQLDQLHARIRAIGAVHECGTDDFVEPEGHRSGGSTKHRPAFRASMLAIKSRPDVGYYLAYDLSRFDRSYDFMSFLMEIDGQGIEFVALHDDVDLETPFGRFMTHIKGGFNAMRREEDGEKMRRALSDLKANGAWLGRPPLGLKAVGKGKDRHLEISDETYIAPDGTPRRYLDTVAEWFRLYARPQAVGAPACAKLLNATGYRWRSKRGEPKLVSLENLDDLHPEQYRGFLPDDLIDRFLDRQRARARRGANGRQAKPDFVPPLLWRVVYCHACGRKFQVRRYRDACDYRHKIGDCEYDGQVRAALLEAQFLQRPELERIKNLDAATIESLAQQAAARVVAPSDVPAKRQALQETLDRLEDLIVDGLISKAKYRERRERAQIELAALPPDAPRGTVTVEDFRKIMYNAKELLTGSGLEPWSRNQLLRSLVHGVYVWKGEIQRIEWTDDAKTWLSC